MANETYHPRGVLVHGYRVGEHPLYSIWAGMKDRCRNPQTPAYQYYGARGIDYCDRWKNFANFAEDMYPRPTGTSLERKDNNKGYCPENCVWATPGQQMRNRRLFKNSQTGLTGIIPIVRGFQARYDDNGIRYDLGNFDTIEEAVVQRNIFIDLYSANDPKFHEMLSKGNDDRRLRRDSSTGVKGISVHEQGYIVRRTINGVREYLGFSKTFDKALDLLRDIK